jgi:hypothetical protein
LDEEEAIKRFLALRPATAEICMARLIWDYATSNPNAGYFTRGAKSMNAVKQHLTWNQLYEVASVCVSRRSLPVLLEEAEPIILEATRKKDNFYTNNAAAYILSERGKKQEAKKYAQRAVEKGKEDGFDTASAERILNAQ